MSSERSPRRPKAGGSQDGANGPESQPDTVAAAPATESTVSIARQLITSIVHDISQPLSSIANFSRASANLLEKGTADWKTLRDWNGEIEAAAKRAAEIFQGFRRLLGPADGDLQPAGINDVVSESIRLAAIDVPSFPIDFQQHLCIENPLVRIHRPQVQQVFVCLFHRVCESIEGRGAGNRQLAVSTAVVGEWAEIVVSDSGPQAPASEPTERLSVGRKREWVDGGLAISRMIVETHGGSLSIAEPHEGATFLVRLPRSRFGADQAS